MTPAAVQRVAVFLPNPVGDVVMATPVLRALRRSLPDAHIVTVARDMAQQVVAGCGWQDGTILDRSGGKPKIRNLRRTAREVKRGRFDLAILLPNSFRKALVAWLGGCRRVVGYRRDGRGWMLSDPVEPPRNDDGTFRAIPTIDYYIALAARAGIEVSDRTMELGIPEADAADAAALLDEADAGGGGPLVMLNPGAAFGTSKMWDPERFASVADALVDRHGAKIIINAAPMDMERRIARHVATAMRHEPLLNFAERDNSIGLLKALIARCDLLITNDTGPRHIAAAVGIGVVTLFGSTDPVWARIDYDRERTIRMDVPCSPCQQKLCPLPAGPTYHQCMTEITPERVLGAAEELLAPARPEAEVRPCS
jgi:heptosyltransferase II